VRAYEDQQEFDSAAAAMATDFKAPPSLFDDVEAPMNRRNLSVHSPHVNPTENLNDFKKPLVRTAKPRTNGVNQ
jgi:hypothetical protein